MTARKRGGGSNPPEQPGRSGRKRDAAKAPTPTAEAPESLPLPPAPGDPPPETAYAQQAQVMGPIDLRELAHRRFLQNTAEDMGTRAGAEPTPSGAEPPVPAPAAPPPSTRSTGSHATLDPRIKEAVAEALKVALPEAIKQHLANAVQDPLADRELLGVHLMRTVVAVPLLGKMQRQRNGLDARARLKVIIDFHNSFPGGKTAARTRVVDLLSLARSATAGREKRRLSELAPRGRREISDSYLFADLFPEEIETLVRLDNGWTTANRTGSGATRPKGAPQDGLNRAIYRVWLDHEINPLVYRSLSTVKADAARAAFKAEGTDIVWAVIDSGIDGTHPHFAKHQNLQGLPRGVEHRDFTSEQSPQPLSDVFGHGTHVAAIMAGELDASGTPLTASTTVLNEQGDMESRVESFDSIRGIAPRCRVVSYKVLDGNGRGHVSNVIAALQEIQRVNDFGRHIKIHGVNLSVGYEYRAEWFACGQSPVCVEVDRLVKSGVVVVVAAGNTGYGTGDARARATSLGFLMSINDPGNADLALTVGATHRDMPHVYGVSYFSSKGPTGDGRLKPDVLAPGEKIISARSSDKPHKPGEPAERTPYVEDSGTSMAAPHVSGAVAAFLSIRREFIGRPERVKGIFMETATDLKRERYLQGNGMIDLMRAIQSV